MAEDVLSELKHIGGTDFDETKATLFLNELYPGQNRSVPDPWYGTEADYKTVFEIIKANCEAIIDKYK
jgi:protein-tyrosine phosphatase